MPTKPLHREQVFGTGAVKCMFINVTVQICLEIDCKQSVISFFFFVSFHCIYQDLETYVNTSSPLKSLQDKKLYLKMRSGALDVNKLWNVECTYTLQIIHNCISSL